MVRDFQLVLAEIRAGDVNRWFMARERRLRYLGAGIIATVGATILLGLLLYILEAQWYVWLGWGIACLILIDRWERTHVLAIELSKRQDRWYFLACIRAARNLDELSQTGLFESIATDARELMACTYGCHETTGLWMSLDYRRVDSTMRDDSYDQLVRALQKSLQNPVHP